MDVTVSPGKLSGSVLPPASKSVSHRALIAASLCGEGFSRIGNLADNADIAATAAAMRAFGAQISVSEGLTLAGGFKVNPSAQIDCGESGSTLRFLLPIAAALGTDAVFSGCGKLPERPYAELADALIANGAVFDRTNGLPVRVSGKLRAGDFELSGGVSSQYVTGLMFALPLLVGDSRIIMTSPLESAAYVDITLSVLKDFGIEIDRTDYGYFVRGNQSYLPRGYTVESDYSGAAFFLAAGALSGGVTVQSLPPDSLQGDREIVRLLGEMGANVRISGDSVTVSGGKLRAIDIDAGEIPDLAPVLSVLLALSEGEGGIYNASRLRIKESDRLLAMFENLTELGADAAMGEDFLRIRGKSALSGGSVKGFGDHRIVMACSVAALRCRKEVKITDAEAVSKSYPRFFEDFRALGGKADVGI